VKVVIIFSILFSINSYSQDKKKAENKEKTYTQKELDAAVYEALEKKIEQFRPRSAVDFSKELLKRERNLSLKEMNLRKREEQIELSAKDLENKLIEFRGSQNKFLSCIDKNDQEKKKRINHMVDIMAGMRPQNAAEVLSVQDSEIAVRILEALPPAKVSKIFNTMNKEISARLQKQFMNMEK
tara:strand:- start:16957 stop:17505 length:549 start_codon:yes stop_codon:yes gene_type:complete